MKARRLTLKHERFEGSDANPVSSRTRETRRAVTLPAYVLLENGDYTQVDVIDLSYDGCSVETPVELTPKSRVKLSVGALGGHDAEVRWYRGGKAGLAFFVQKAEDRAFVQRDHERVQISAEIALRRVGRQHYTAKVFDLSNHGCKVEFVERPRLDELVWVKFESLEAIEAEVCWVDGFHGGLKFLRPIYPAVYDLLLARMLPGDAA
jgi:hypothetical protein